MSGACGPRPDRLRRACCGALAEVPAPLPVGTDLRHLRLNVTADTGWPAAQFSEVEAYLS
ncbi:hypothetical protein QFZ55_007045 [Streptomyces luteogriseus]|nr:hypothetical protein [Streptomyces luteogriseus]